MQLKNKKITVVGLARSGVYSAKLCVSLGGIVTVSDKKSEAELAEFTAQLQGVIYKLETGGHSEEAFLGADLIVVSPGVPTDTEIFS